MSPRPRVVRTLRATLASALFALALSACPARAATIGLTPLAPPSVTTLLFHQISDDPIHSAHGEDNVKEPWLSPAQFDALLGTLEGRGYHFVSLDRAIAGLGGTPEALPPKALLITFDDGYASALSSATAILRKHHATATMFFEGKITKGLKAGRLTLADLRAMRASGVWQLASHGWIGHGNLPVAADGRTSPYWYGNLMWRAADGRLETLAEYEARIADDLHHFRSTFEPLLKTRLDVFAYPSGEYGQNGALTPGGNPSTRLEAGHSNSRDLTNVLTRVLAHEGFRAAFAVAVPGAVHAASPQDGPYTFPRIGVGSRFDPAILDAIATEGFELPEITSADTFADCTTLVHANDRYLTASVGRPELFQLAEDGRPRATIDVPQLLDDRRNEPALVSALIARGNDVTVLQQAGWWPAATPYLTKITLADGRATVVAREALPANLNWTVGAIERDGKLVAMTDEGRFYDVADARGAPLFSVALAAGERHARFVGPAVVRGRTFVVDRTLAMLEEIDARGEVLATSALGGDVRAIASRGTSELLAVDWAAQRRIVRRFVVSP